MGMLIKRGSYHFLQEEEDIKSLRPPELMKLGREIIRLEYEEDIVSRDAFVFWAWTCAHTSYLQDREDLYPEQSVLSDRAFIINYLKYAHLPLSDSHESKSIPLSLNWSLLNTSIFSLIEGISRRKTEQVDESGLVKTRIDPNPCPWMGEKQKGHRVYLGESLWLCLNGLDNPAKDIIHSIRDEMGVLFNNRYEDYLKKRLCQTDNTEDVDWFWAIEEVRNLHAHGEDPMGGGVETILFSLFCILIWDEMNDSEYLPGKVSSHSRRLRGHPIWPSAYYPL